MFQQHNPMLPAKTGDKAQVIQQFWYVNFPVEFWGRWNQKVHISSPHGVNDAHISKILAINHKTPAPDQHQVLKNPSRMQPA
ncbi:MAG: hypothetical protein A2X46_13990 [Lentisphaerae bacterium GWF2_57_35]|nr:MAG: hypothetical protein A2X46_13990 [Lentisphaerae bacterium GWF2_57_35]